MKKNKIQTVTLDAISRIVREEVGEIKKDISSLKTDVSGLRTDFSGMKKDIVVVKKKVSSIDQRLKDFSHDYTEIDLETRGINIEDKLGITVPTESNGA